MTCTKGKILPSIQCSLNHTITKLESVWQDIEHSYHVILIVKPLSTSVSLKMYLINKGPMINHLTIQLILQADLPA